MFGLGFLKRHKTPDGVPPASGGTSPTTVTPVRLGARSYLGRRLAFCITDQAIQMAAAVHGYNRPTLIATQKSYVPGTMTDDAQRADFVNRTVLDFVAQHGGHSPRASLAVSGPRTALRTFTLPALSRSKLSGAIGYEVKRQVPFPPDDCLYDYRLIERIEHDKERKVRAAILAATRTEVAARLAPIRQAGCEVDEVYVSQDVIGRLLTSLKGFNHSVYYTLIDIQPQRTEVAYYHGGNLAFVHTSSVGSSFLRRRSDPTVYEYFAESLATEIQNSLDYYGGQFATHQAPEVFIYGDLSYSADLADRLTDRFGFKFRRFPVEDLNIPVARELHDNETLAVCLPAVAACCNRVCLPNLLPVEAKHRLHQKSIDRYSIAALVALTLTGGSQWLATAGELNAQRDQLAAMKQVVAQLQSSEAYHTYQVLKNKISGDQSFITKINEQHPNVAVGLKEISRLTPSAIQLFNLEYQHGQGEANMLLSGLVRTNTTPPELVLAEFVENLTASSLFADVTVERHIKRRQPDGFLMEFHLNLRSRV